MEWYAVDGVSGEDRSWIWNSINTDTSLFSELSTAVEMSDSPVPSPVDFFNLEPQQNLQPLAVRIYSPVSNSAGLLPQPSTSQGSYCNIESTLFSCPKGSSKRGCDTQDVNYEYITDNKTLDEKLLQCIKEWQPIDSETLEKIYTSENFASCSLDDEISTQQSHLTEHKKTYSNKDTSLLSDQSLNLEPFTAITNSPVSSQAGLLPQSLPIASVVSPYYAQGLLTDLSVIVCPEMDCNNHENNAEVSTSCKNVKTSNTEKTAIKPYRCPEKECGKTFTQRCHLNRHNLIHTGKKSFFCTICGKGFAQRSHLNKHNSTHTGKKPFICNICGKDFPHQGSLTRHNLIHTGKKPFTCITCGKRFALRAGLIRHNRTHTGERPYQCGTCGKAFSDSSGLVSHNRTHPGERSFICTSCGKAFNLNCDLIIHNRTHTGESPFVCGVGDCKYAATSNNNLMRHRRRMHLIYLSSFSDFSSIIEAVNSPVSSPAGLLPQSSSTSPAVSPYYEPGVLTDLTGTICPKMDYNSHKNNTNVGNSVAKSNSSDTKSNSSDAESSSSDTESSSSDTEPSSSDAKSSSSDAKSSSSDAKSSSSDAKSSSSDAKSGSSDAKSSSSDTESNSSDAKSPSVITHHREIVTPPLCKESNKPNKSNKPLFKSDHLKSHIRIHTRERPFICIICNNAFFKSDHLKSHMRIHTGERPFICIICKKTFARSDNLKTHMRFHTGERPHQCRTCGKMFAIRADLIRHKLIHTGEKPHQCHTCGKMFAQQGNLKRHQRIHTR